MSYKEHFKWLGMFSVGYVMTLMYPEEFLSIGMLSHSATLVLSLSALILTVFALFLGSLYPELLKKIVYQTATPDHNEQSVYNSFITASSIAVLAVITIVAGKVIAPAVSGLFDFFGAYLGHTSMMRINECFDTSITTRLQFSIGIVHGLTILQMYALVHGLHPLLKSKRSVDTATAAQERENKRRDVLPSEEIKYGDDESE